MIISSVNSSWSQATSCDHPVALDRLGDPEAARLQPIRLVLVEDDARLLHTLHEALAAQPAFEILSVHDSAEDALGTADWEHCAILLTDLTLPGLSGVELIHRVATIAPEVTIAAYTVNDQRQEVLSAIRAGASGYILKRHSLAEISAAIRELAAGGAPISPSVGGMILDALRSVDSQPDLPLLSPREAEILRLAADGFQRKEIADQLGLSLHTVHSHTKRIYKKLQVNGRREALAKIRGSVQL